MKTWKQYLLNLVVTVLLCAAMTPAAFAAFDGTYIDYRAWSQDQLPWGTARLGDAAEYGSFNYYGCFVVSFSKLAVQLGVRTPGADFNPAVVNQLFADYDITNSSGQIKHEKRGLAAELVGLAYAGTIPADRDTILSYLRNNEKKYSVIMYVSSINHFVPIDRETSLATGDIYFHESWTKSGNPMSTNYDTVASAYSTGTRNERYYTQNLISKNFYTTYGKPSNAYLFYAPCQHKYEFNKSTETAACIHCGEVYIVPALTRYEAFMDIVAVNKDSNTAPAHKTPYGDSAITPGSRYDLGDTVYVMGYVKNAFGNTWYQLATGEWVTGDYLGDHVHRRNGDGYCTRCLDRLNIMFMYMNPITLSAQNKAFPIHYAPYGDSAKFPITCSGSARINGKIVNGYGNVWYSLESGGWVFGNYLYKSVEKGRVNLSGTLSLYNEPSHSARQLAAIPAGEEVYVYTDETYGNWYSVLGYDGNSGKLQIGFADKSCISLFDDHKVVEPPYNAIEPLPPLTDDGDQPSNPPSDPVPNPGPTTVAISYPTDPTYVGKISVSDTNATVVANIVKPAGSHVSACGLLLCDASSAVIKDHYEPLSNVGNSLTSFHAWYDIQSELGVTLTPGTTYTYRFYTVVDGNTYWGDPCSFTTTGTPPSGEIPPQETVFTVSGIVSGGGATVTAGGTSVEVNSDGTFSVSTAESTFDVTVKRTGCLTYTVQNVTPNGANVDLGTITLLAGDVDGNDLINARDINGFRKEFGKSGEAIGNMAADMNGDGNVNARDINVLRKNFGKSAAKDCTVLF